MTFNHPLTGHRLRARVRVLLAKVLPGLGSLLR